MTKPHVNDMPFDNFNRRRSHSAQLSETQIYKLTMKECVCAIGAGSLSAVITYPLHKGNFFQINNNTNITQALLLLCNELKQGPATLFRGLLPPLIQITVARTIMNSSYYGYLRQLQGCTPNTSTLTVQFVAGVMSGCTEALLYTPLERVQILLQQQKYNNTLHAFSDLRSYGLQEYYRGFFTIFLRNGTGTVLYYLHKDRVKALFPETTSSYVNCAQYFASGGLLGGVVSTICYPLHFVKTKLQSKELGLPSDGFVKLCKIVYKESKESKRIEFMRGASTNFARSLISWGIFTASYEWLQTNYTSLFR